MDAAPFLSLAVAPWVLAIVVPLVVVAAGMSQGGLGFGYAIVSLTTLPLVLAPKDAHVVVSLSGIAVVAASVYATRADADWRLTRVATLAGAAMVPVGQIAFKALSPDGLVRLTGGVILVLMLRELWVTREPEEATAAPPATRHPDQLADDTPNKPPESPPQEPLLGPLLAGAVSGGLAGAVSIGGPPIAAYAMSRPWTPGRSRAFITRFLLVIAVIRAMGLAANRFVTCELAGYAGAAAVFAIGGVFLGAWLSRGLKTDSYRRTVAIVLVGLSLYYLVRGDGSRGEAPEDRSETAVRVAPAINPMG